MSYGVSALRQGRTESNQTPGHPAAPRDRFRLIEPPPSCAPHHVVRCIRPATRSYGIYRPLRSLQPESRVRSSPRGTQSARPLLHPSLPQSPANHANPASARSTPPPVATTLLCTSSKFALASTARRYTPLFRSPPVARPPSARTARYTAVSSHSLPHT